MHGSKKAKAKKLYFIALTHSLSPLHALIFLSFLPLSPFYAIFQLMTLSSFSFQIWYVGLFYGFCKLEFCEFFFFFVANLCVSVFRFEEK